jgi:L,D-transpeptidase YcbB
MAGMRSARHFSKYHSTIRSISSSHMFPTFLALARHLFFAIASVIAFSAHAAAPLEVSTALRDLLRTEYAPLRIGEVEIKSLRLIRRLYAARDYQPLWSEAARQSLLVAIADSALEGLEPADYPQPHTALVNALPAADHAAQEIVLTEALVRLAYSLRLGKANPAALDPAWNYARALGTSNPIAWITTAIEGHDINTAVSTLRPATPYYMVLRSALADHRVRAARGGWPKITSGPTLRPGTRDPRIQELRARLGGADSVVAPNANATFFDEQLLLAVRQFQDRHGLAIDGLVGRATLAALNVPITDRINTLRVNLERIRWLFHDFDAEFLAVNIAAFYAAYLNHGYVRWQARVVVGRPYRQTPSFTSQITSLELNPTWTVPPTILAQDILPKVRENLLYLREKKLQVFDRSGQIIDPVTVNWQLPASRFPYVLRQPPGDDNALGRIKFLFPNPHTVYLHDTPARDLFAQPARVFSSGCIRIERPLELAEILLRDHTWDAASLQTAIDTGKRQRLTLSTPVTIMLFYLTAFPDEHGDVHFRADVYDRDRAVLDALAAEFTFAPPTDYVVDPEPAR